MSPVQPPTLCDTFQQLSAEIWDDLELAERAGLQRDEETITNDLLLDLYRTHAAEVVILQFNKPQESIIGADWLWALTDGTTWFAMLVQAKRLYRPSERYERLTHTVGPNNTPQIDLLIDAARRLQVAPAYVFYNYTVQSPTHRMNWNCRSIPRSDRLFGCSVAEATAVGSILASKNDNIIAVGGVSYPLRCLTCCQVLGTSLPTTAHGILSASLRRVSTPTSGVTSAEPAPSQNAPWWASRILDQPVDARQRVASLIANDLRPQDPALQGIVVVRERHQDGT
jgi:hypothetical protein